MLEKSIMLPSENVNTGQSGSVLAPGCPAGGVGRRPARISSALLAFSVLAGGVCSSAVAAEPTAGELGKMIEAQQQQLNDLKAALARAEAKAENAAAKAETAATGQAAGETGKSFLDSISIGGAVEVEVTSGTDFTGTDSSDITLGTAEVFLDAKPTDYVETHLQLLYEDDGTETISLDEAWAVLGNPEEFPVWLQAGKWAVPFGGFDTAMSSDPLTQTLGETKEAAILVGAGTNGFSASGYVYNGDTSRAGDDDVIGQFGFAAGYEGEAAGASFNAGVGFISNIADSDGITEGLGANSAALDDYVPGVEAHAAVGFAGVTVRGGYMTATDNFDAAQLAYGTAGARPSAWTAEGSYDFAMLGQEATAAVTVQGSDEALALGLPALRTGGALTVGVFQGTSVTAEYLHDEDYSKGKGGTGEDGHAATLKLAVEF